MDENNVIFEYQKTIKRIYEDVNRKREEITPLEISLSMSLSNIFNAKYTSDFIVSISWLFSLANKYNIDITDALLRKHPDKCHYCLESPCICSITDKEPKPKISERKKEEKREYFYSLIRKTDTFDFKYFVEKINKIFPANRNDYKNHGNLYHIRKIFEEMGELLQVINKFKQDNNVIISMEFADLFYWLLSLWSASFPNDNYDVLFEDYYLNGCKKCHSEICQCINVTVLRDYIENDQLVAYRDAIMKHKFPTVDIAISNEMIQDAIFAIKSKDNEGRKDIVVKLENFCKEHGIVIDNRRSYRL